MGLPRDFRCGDAERQLESRWPGFILNCVEQRKGGRKRTEQSSEFRGLMELSRGRDHGGCGHRATVRP